MLNSIKRGAFKAPMDGYLLIASKNDWTTIKWYNKGGARAILTDHVIRDLPCIVVNDLDLSIFKLCSWMNEAINLPSVIVSGSIGKTTTKRMINVVLEQQKAVFSTNKNHNMLIELCCYLQNVKVNDQIVVWEVCENLQADAQYSSLALKPGIVAITNIGNSHLGSIGGKEAQIRCFRSLTAGMDEKGFVIKNADDPDSAETEFDKKTITIGIYNTAADCVAYNITNKRKGTEFDIRFQNEVTHVKLTVFGEHNVYNAMTAFVVGTLQGIRKQSILNGLKHFRNVGFRQNIIRIGNTVVYADFYNASSKSVSYAISCFCSLPSIRGKRVAVLGDIAEIEGYEESTYQEIAKAIDNSTIDILITYGTDSKMIQKFIKRDMEMQHCSSSEELNQCLKTLKNNQKCSFLLKASRSMYMENNMKAAFPAHYYLMRGIEKLTIKYLWEE